MSKEELIKHYELNKESIKGALENFESMMNKSDEEIFSEMAYCILTPMSRADRAHEIIKKLEKNNLLFNGTEDQIRPFLNTIRFHSEKAKRIVENRKFFMVNEKLKIKEKINKFSENPILLRDWLEENVKGYGWKESSHFIRNIGLSKNQLAILDRHILKNLKELGVIDTDKRPSTKKKYLEIENKMKDFANNLGMTLDELDIVLWSKETGFIFK